jgi:hypothetical protein
MTGKPVSYTWIGIATYVPLARTPFIPQSLLLRDLKYRLVSPRISFTLIPCHAPDWVAAPVSDNPCGFALN